MQIVGISAFYHDSAAVLVRDGQVVAAAQEERFTRKKFDADFPRQALAYVLGAGKTALARVDHVVFYEKPFLKFERLLSTYLAFAPRGVRSFAQALPVWVREKLFQKKLLVEELARVEPAIDWYDRLLFAEHHVSHAASAFFPSPFEEAAILTMDGTGEWATTSAGIGRGARVQLTKEIHFPHSLGLLYSAFTYYTGFRVNSGEYKLMGLAPYGQPRYAQRILDHLIDLKPDGSFRLNLDYFDYCTGLRMTNARFDALFEGPPRQAEGALEPRHMDIAASIQQVTEEVVLRLTRALAAETGLPNLCLAGGVALNCVANGKLLREGRFKSIWVQPAAGDAGGALGAALAGYHHHVGGVRERVTPDGMAGSFLGPEYSPEEIEQALNGAGARFTRHEQTELVGHVARALAGGLAVGWFQQRMEYGPRALGARSILADPRSAEMQSTLNLKIKYRESFRPFAPVVTREDLTEWFDLDVDSPYMLLVADVAAAHRIALTAEQDRLEGMAKLRLRRSDIPAVTHVDNSARIETVDRATNPLFHALLTEWKRISGCPVLVNTSFNVRGEPIVCTPSDAFRCFMGTELDVLAVGPYLLHKREQDPARRSDHAQGFAPD
jgi:carbamoyltransferase